MHKGSVTGEPSSPIEKLKRKCLVCKSSFVSMFAWDAGDTYWECEIGRLLRLGVWDRRCEVVGMNILLPPGQLGVPESVYVLTSIVAHVIKIMFLFLVE